MNRPAKQALINYFQGISPAEEQEAIEAYLAMDIDTVYVKLCLKEAMANLSYENSADTKLTDKAWFDFEKSLEEKLYALPKRSINLVRYAAAIIILVSVGLAFNMVHKASAPQPLVTYQRIQAGYGTLRQVILPDSSHISLFPGTVIDVPSNYNALNRKVFLGGRAYFEVAHNRQKPFYVITSTLTTRVLGTSFEVSAPAKNYKASVVLRTGRVCVSNEHKQVLAILHPGQQLVYHRHNGKYLKQAVHLNQLFGWTKGEISFDQTSLAEICQTLEAWYNLKIEVKSKHLLQKKITATFKNQSSAQVLKILAATAGFTYRSNNQIIQIY